MARNRNELMKSFSQLDSTQWRLCVRCQKLAILCICFKKGVSSKYKDPQTCSKCDTFFGEILDIEPTESQPENDLDMASPLCDKSHQHHEFIHMDHFSISDLPDELHHVSVYVWLRNCSPLVVRLLRNITATGRACLIPQEFGRTSSCDDADCPYLSFLGSPHEVYGGIGIITNKHVVQSDKEASMTKVEFFYNDNNDRIMVMKEKGLNVHFTNQKMDYTMFNCFVHRKELIDMIATFDKRRNYAWLEIPEDIRTISKEYAIVISHPHGAAKKISFGKVIGREAYDLFKDELDNVRTLRDIYNICERTNSEENKALQRFAEYVRLVPNINLSFTKTWYTTATCKGSSGAPVYMGNVVRENQEEINQAHTHRGVDSHKGYNNCFT